MAIGTIAAIIIGLSIAVAALGIIIITMQITKKVTARTLKKLIKNNDRINKAHKAIVHNKEGSLVKLDILDEKDEKFAELHVTGTSSSRMLREGRRIRV